MGARDLEVYTANLQHGGIVVQAASFLDELPAFRESLLGSFDRIRLVTSNATWRNCRRRAEICSSGVELTVQDDSPYPRRALPGRHRLAARLAYSGPEYFGRRARWEVGGFADAYIAPRASKMQWNQIHRPNAWKRAYQRARLRKYDALFTETEWIANELRAYLPARPVEVVPNAPASLFAEPKRWRAPRHDLPQDQCLKLFYPSRGYSHKNHNLLPAICEAFKTLTGESLRVVTTLRPDEWNRLSLEHCRHILNIGEVELHDLPGLYEMTDGVVFPSLLEVCSVTPLEAMMMHKPVVAARTRYNMANYGDNVAYFDPADPVDAARCIVETFFYSNGPDVASAHQFASSMPDSAARAEQVIRMVTAGA